MLGSGQGVVQRGQPRGLFRNDFERDRKSLRKEEETACFSILPAGFIGSGDIRLEGSDISRTASSVGGKECMGTECGRSSGYC